MFVRDIGAVRDVIGDAARTGGSKEMLGQESVKSMMETN
jgi:hypothetical protein